MEMPPRANRFINLTALVSVSVLFVAQSFVSLTLIEFIEPLTA